MPIEPAKDGSFKRVKGGWFRPWELFDGGQLLRGYCTGHFGAVLYKVQLAPLQRCANIEGREKR